MAAPSVKALQSRLGLQPSLLREPSLATASSPLQKVRASANPSPVLERGGAYAHRELAQAKGGQEQALWEEEAPAAPVVRKIGAGKERKR